jgi:hypothetical protein
MVVGEHPTSGRAVPVNKDPNASRAPRRTSVRQIEANRKNALRSTGPTTPEGKQASRRNALKHGLRAKELVIPGLEDPAEYEALLSELCDDWQPEGHTEIHLVEQLAQDEWRLRRARRAELGEIRSQISGSAASDIEDEIERAFQLPLMGLSKILRKSTVGFAYLRYAVEMALDELESRGTVSKKTCEYLDRVFGEGRDSPSTIVRVGILGEMPAWLKDDSDSNDELAPMLEKGERDRKAAARERLELTLEDLVRQDRKLHKQERANLEIARQRLSIPQSPALEGIQRYETAIKRDMYRAMDQLDRLQRRRRGEPPPPTMNVNVSKDD